MTRPVQNSPTAFFIGSLAGGGAERSTLLIAKQLALEAYPVRLVLGRLEGPYVQEIPSALAVDCIGGTRYVEIPGFLTRCRSLIQSAGVEALFAIDRQARILIAGRAIRVIPKVSIVVVGHSTLSVALADRFPNRLVRGAVRRLTGWLYRRADAIVGVSDGVSRDLEVTLGLPAGSVVTIYNPVDTERITEATVEAVPHELSGPFEALRRPVVITTGRLVTAKAHSDLLAAFALLPESRRGSLVILGEGPLRGGLEQQAERLGIADRVWMPGFVDNPWWFMARSDVFALSSHWEGFGLVLVEALACNVPIVSTNCPSGPAEILADTPGTCLTTVASPQKMANAIVRLMRDGQRPAAELTRYSPQHASALYANLVSRIIRF